MTAACLTCHTEASRQLMKTSHWTWICPRARKELEEKQGRIVGKGRFDRLDPTRPIVRINTPEGDHGDPRSRIWPVKIHRGVQMYDPVRKVLAVPKLFPSEPNKDDAYWKNYDWKRIRRRGRTRRAEPGTGLPSPERQSRET